ncbi:hypothetical protein RND71_008102 [Anisodus tanguticus]|uniref:Uncharacterized protein n=1 Tax=Anisodus tanguticus TaxID=243964 RepID=A0AAE1SK59_9SOLA|nr:hypothetical protein RND71_008102 [Anisodus tanguticus]
MMSGPSFSLHIDDSQSVSVSSPKLNQGDPKSYDDPKPRHSEKVDEVVTGKLLHNLLMKEVRSLDDDALHLMVSGAKLLFGLGHFAEYVFDRTPHILNWKVEKNIGHGYVCLRILGLQPDEAPKPDMGQSSLGDGESSSVDMKKELESFWVHVDSKFAEIFQAIVDLSKKVGAERGLPCSWGDENVKDVTSNDGVGGGDSSKETVGGGAGDGVGGGVGVGKGNDSQSNFVFVSDFLDDEFFKYLSETGITMITQAAKVGVVSTEVVGDEQSIKYGCPENTTVHVDVIEQAREEVLPQGGQLAYEVTTISEDTVKDYGVGPSRASDGDSDYEEEAPNFVIPPVMNVVEINDDQKTHIEPQRGRPR